MPRSDLFTVNLINLFLPKKRQAAIEWLVDQKLLSSESAAAFSRRLSGGHYTWRGSAKELLLPLMELEAVLGRNRYSMISPQKWVNQLETWSAASKSAMGLEIFSQGQLDKKTVLDFGAGRINPFAIGIILFANGAENVIALEPGPIDAAGVEFCTAQVVNRLMMDTGMFNVSKSRPKGIRRRLAELNLKPLTKISDSPEVDLGGVALRRSIDQVESNAVDYVFSTSVFEHVDDLRKEIEHHKRVMKPGGIGVHTVDFTDHKKTSRNFDTFGQYYRDTPGLNYLRCSDVIDLFKEHGFAVEVTAKKIATDYSVDRDRILDRLEHYADDDLLVRQATFVVRAPGRPRAAFSLRSLVGASR